MSPVVFPIIIPIFAAALCLIAAKSPRTQRVIAGIASHLCLLLSVFLLRRASEGRIDVIHFGNWTGGFGIVFYLDAFSAMMLVLAAMIMVVTWWFSAFASEPPEAQRPYFYPLLLIISAGVHWAFLTGDLFNLFVSFELILLASYVLLTDPSKLTSLKESYRFLLVNAISGTLFLMAAGLTYGAYGTLNMAELSVRVQSESTPHAAIFGSFLLIVFGLKAAIFPLFTWLPSAYPKMPLSILPFLTGLLTKVGVYTLYRIYPLIFIQGAPEWFQPLLLGIAAITMLSGVFAALGQWSMRDILSIHIISQIGYMVFGLALLTPMGLAGGMLSLSHNIVVKTALFLTAGIVVLAYGTDKLKDIGGIMSTMPFAAVLFFVAAISLAGLPPSSGFFNKWILVMEGVRTEHFWVTTAAVVTGLFTLASMAKIFIYAFWGEEKGSLVGSVIHTKGATAVAGGLVAVAILYVVASGPITNLCLLAADQLLDPTLYQNAVLGSAAPVQSALAHAEVIVP